MAFPAYYYDDYSTNTETASDDGRDIDFSDLAGLTPTQQDELLFWHCLLYTSPSPRDGLLSRMPSSA